MDVIITLLPHFDARSILKLITVSKKIWKHRSDLYKGLVLGHDGDLSRKAYFRRFRGIMHVHTLDLSYTNMWITSFLGNIHTLILNHTHVYDVSALGGVHTLDLSNTHVYDVSALGGVHTLILRFTRVYDVSNLKNVNIIR